MGAAAISQLSLPEPCFCDEDAYNNDELTVVTPWPEEEASFQCSRILCYGDSLTAGYYNNGRSFSPYGTALEDALTSLGLECEVSINGLSGHCADQMVKELDSPVCQDICGRLGKGLAHILDNERHYDLVILMAGTNDFGGNSNLKSIQNDVCELHDACHARGVPTVMLAAPCNAENMRTGLSQILRRWAQKQDQVMSFIDPEEVIPRRTRSYWEPDQVHFTPSGSHALGLYLAPIVADILLEHTACEEPSVRNHLSQMFCEEPSVGTHGWSRYAARGGA